MVDPSRKWAEPGAGRADMWPLRGPHVAEPRPTSVEAAAGNRSLAAQTSPDTASAEACPIDVRPAVVQNVVVVGGCATIRGVLPRLAVELQGALKRGERTAAMAAMLRFTPLDFPPVGLARARVRRWGAPG